MKDNVQPGELPDGMDKYIKTRTYIDATDLRSDDNMQLFKKKLLFTMPRTPIVKLKGGPRSSAGADFRPPLFLRMFTYESLLGRMVTYETPV